MDKTRRYLSYYLSSECVTANPVAVNLRRVSAPWAADVSYIRRVSTQTEVYAFAACNTACSNYQIEADTFSNRMLRWYRGAMRYRNQDDYSFANNPLDFRYQVARNPCFWLNPPVHDVDPC